MTTTTKKTIALVLSDDEKRFGSYRAVNYGVSGIVVYHDSDRRQGLACVGTWEEAEAWCLARMTPANDTASSLPVGRTVESSTWRAHRFAGHVEIVDLRNAGKRGKACLELSLSGREEAVEMALPFVVDAVAAETSPEAFEASLVDLTIPGVAFTRRELKAITVPRDPEIQIVSDLVSGHCSQVDGVLSFTAIHGRPNGESFRQDTLTSPESRKDAAKLHAWLKETGAAVAKMTISAFRAEMRLQGIRVS